MFDWDDEELTNIIWDEAGATDDHIVPHPEGNEERASGLFRDHVKQGSNEEVTNNKSAEQKKPASKTDITGVKRERSSQHDNLSSSHSVKTDQDPLGTEASNIAKDNSLKDVFPLDEASQLGLNGSDIFLNQQEDKEHIGFVDYGWDSIGSFDDLDKIFSNDDPIFGRVSLGNADQLWSSSKDITSVPDSTFPVSPSSSSLASGGAFENTSEHSVVKKEFRQDLDQSWVHPCGETIYLTSQDQENLHSLGGQIDRAGGNCQPVGKEKKELDMLGNTAELNSQLPAETIATVNEYPGKVHKEKKIFKSQKRIERELEAEGPLLQDSYSSWYDGNQIQEFGQIVPSLPHSSLSSAMKQQTQLQGPWPAHYQQPPNSVVSHDVYGSSKNDSVTNSFKRTHSREENEPVKPPTMTPQEKIEKLRRRQQMQALLAIQKQQQQFRHQVSSNDQPVAQHFLNENQIQLMRGGNTEVQETISTPLIDPDSAGEQYDSNTISAAVYDYRSVEEIALHQLQDVIAKLDTKIRLCIRDSLFRLAQSAMQRQYAGDTGSSNLRKDETISDNRFSEKPDVETATNPIDRTVAHLLFHRPLESSQLNDQTPESPASMKLERGLSRSSQFKGPPGNASKDEAVDAAGDMGIEASQ